MTVKRPEKLWKTTIVIWSDYNGSQVELEDLARDAVSGDAFCSQQSSELITDAAQFPDTDFFGETGDGE